MVFDIMDVPYIYQGRSVSIFTSLPSSELGWSGWLGIIYDFDKGDTDFCSLLPSDSMNADGKRDSFELNDMFYYIALKIIHLIKKLALGILDQGVP